MTFRIEINGQLTCMCAYGSEGAEAAAEAWRKKAQPGAFGWLSDQYGFPLSVVALPFDLLAADNIVPISKEQIEELLSEEA